METELKPCQCGAGCCYNMRGELCWGRVEVEDWAQDEEGAEIAIHACRGHATLVNHGGYDGKYTPPPKPVADEAAKR